MSQLCHPRLYGTVPRAWLSPDGMKGGAPTDSAKPLGEGCHHLLLILSPNSS